MLLRFAHVRMIPTVDLINEFGENEVQNIVCIMVCLNIVKLFQNLGQFKDYT